MLTTFISPSLSLAFFFTSPWSKVTEPVHLGQTKGISTEKEREQSRAKQKKKIQQREREMKGYSLWWLSIVELERKIKN
jgi:hypothetical protein